MPTGVTIHESEKCYEGYTLFNETYEFPEKAPDGKGKIYLVDMDGEPVHRWEVETAVQSHTRLLPNGNLLYPTRDRSNIEEAGLRELDPESNVVWSYHCRIDHDYQVMDNDHLMLHTITDNMVPEIGPELRRNPYIVETDREKNLHWEWFGEDHYDELRQLLSADDWAFVEERIATDYAFDWAHNNTLQIIPENETYRKELEGDGPVRFEPGNIVFSYRSVDVIGVIDYPSGEIVWAWGPSELDGQHLPYMLENGNLLIFDNGTERGWSRVIEVDPLTEEIVWEYRGSPKEDFYAPFISGAQRLPNGNTLICEGTKAHLFEVTPDGEVVWDFVSPFGEEGSMGNVYRCLRYSPEYVEPLLNSI
ncbi:aryl-sulfate sulfotransferase [Natronosalvus amylolyticus]|uniref:aryl-sulfate sulfotransferase n=1 Tax=Natronosalvus amylolyticus TaxID=2961994 RepID=UPI0020C99306|nr:aryl-sulfate sulfotransferase [Natronosalvus amylolyticus]